MLKHVEVPELFRVLAAKAAELREKEYGPPCLEVGCPRRVSRCSGPTNVIPFRRAK